MRNFSVFIGLPLTPVADAPKYGLDRNNASLQPVEYTGNFVSQEDNGKEMKSIRQKSSATVWQQSFNLIPSVLHPTKTGCMSAPEKRAKGLEPLTSSLAS